MISLLASVGWGLLAIGAITHIWHHGRLRYLIGMHIDHERVPALALTGVEAVLAIGIPVAWIAGWRALTIFALVGGIVGFVFVLWIARLLFSNSELPCACSFSEAPTTGWSLARAGMVPLVVLFGLVPDVGVENVATAEALTTLIVGLALASAIFVLPEAISWPDASRALMARVDAYDAEATTP